MSSGIGVIGEQPVILPNTSFEYSSACPLGTPSGRMVRHNPPPPNYQILTPYEYTNCILSPLFILLKSCYFLMLAQTVLFYMFIVIIGGRLWVEAYW